LSATEPQTFDAAYVKTLREENASWRTRAHAAETAYSVHVNRYPLGDLDKFSVSRAAMAQRLSDGRFEGHAWDKFAPYEKAWIEAESKAAQGDQVSGVDGGFLAPENWNQQWFDLLRSFTVLDRLPISRFSVPLRVTHLPKVTNDVSVYYPAENAVITSSQFKFGQLSYTARKSSALLNVSNELIRDAASVADAVFRQSTAMAIALDRDTQLLTGSGGGNGLQPTGIITAATAGTISKYYPGASATTDISTAAAHGTPSFLHVSSLRSKVANLNGATNVQAGQGKCTGVIAHSRFERTVHTIASAAGAWTDAQGRPLWMGGLNGDGGPNADNNGVGSLMGLDWAFTNILPTNSTDGGGTTSSFMIAGYWQRYALFECMTPTYAATPLSGTSSTGFAADQTQIRVVYRYDGQPVQPEAFAVLAGCDQ
jgi:HK97 family phage major capsid protein